ncbi:MAG: DUF2752 domain-containing protein, partial [Daejeonella sp.]
MSLQLIILIKQNAFINWLQHNLLACPLKQITGIDCPGCGLQRSVLCLIQGNFLESFKLYPASIAIIMLFILTALHLKFDFKNGAFFIKIIYISIAIIIVINYIYKIF